jgi:Na+/H+-dicarboxylate symporter
MVLFTIWLVLAIVFFFLTNKSINSNAGNISYKRKAVFVTCLLIGLFWPLFIILAIIIWLIQRSRGRKILKEIDDKLSSVFNK